MNDICNWIIFKTKVVLLLVHVFQYFLFGFVGRREVAPISVFRLP